MYAPGAFVLALGALRGRAAHHRGVPLRCRVWLARARHGRVRRLRAVLPPGYVANLATSWLPALDGVVDKLRTGGQRRRRRLRAWRLDGPLANEYPQTRLSGFDYHDKSIELARKRAADAGVSERVTFDVATAQNFPGTGYDLITTFDCLHDMGDPLGAARHIRQALAPDGTWMIVEPFANDSVPANLNPIGRVYYSFSSFLCVPNALSQNGGYSLGAQAGEAAIRQLVTDAGFTGFRRATETPFNLVYEVRR